MNKMENAIVDILMDTYQVSFDQAVDIANGIYFYMLESVLPVAASDNDLVERGGKDE